MYDMENGACVLTFLCLCALIGEYWCVNHKMVPSAASQVLGAAFSMRAKWQLHFERLRDLKFSSYLKSIIPLHIHVFEQYDFWNASHSSLDKVNNFMDDTFSSNRCYRPRNISRIPNLSINKGPELKDKRERNSKFEQYS